jgi:hypothetical protein
VLESVDAMPNTKPFMALMQRLQLKQGLSLQPPILRQKSTPPMQLHSGRSSALLHSNPSLLQSAVVSQVPSGSQDELGAMPGSTCTGTAADDKPSGAQKSSVELDRTAAGAAVVVVALARLGAVRMQPAVPLVAAMESMSQSPSDVHSPAARLPAH